jgi:hypothetical protein
MPQYEKYEGESQEAADARIAKNIQSDELPSQERAAVKETYDDEDSYSEGESDGYMKNFNYLLKNMPGDAKMSEIIGWDDNRDEVGLYAVRTDEGLKFVYGLTDRWTGYGKRGNPNYKTSADAKYGSARKKSDNGDFLSYEDAYEIYKRQAKRKEPGITEKVMKSISNYMGGEE